MTAATAMVNAPMLARLPARPLSWLAMAVALGGLVTAWHSVRAGRGRTAFLGSCAFLAGMMAATATCLFPIMLRAIDDESRSLTAHNSAVPVSSLQIALGWFAIGLPLAIAYFVGLFRLHRGTVRAASGREGY